MACVLSGARTIAEFAEAIAYEDASDAEREDVYKRQGYTRLLGGGTCQLRPR